jgi:hypothetical protein
MVVKTNIQQENFNLDYKSINLRSMQISSLVRETTISLSETIVSHTLPYSIMPKSLLPSGVAQFNSDRPINSNLLSLSLLMPNLANLRTAQQDSKQPII